MRRVSFYKGWGVPAAFVSPTVTLSAVIGGSTSSTNKGRLGNEERLRLGGSFEQRASVVLPQ
jgi:hypothetical protein